MNISFPSPRNNQSSAEIAPNQPVQIPSGIWFEMDEDVGAEKLWLVWSASGYSGMGLVEESGTMKEIRAQSKMWARSKLH